jgi:NADH-quinone oxidoreductase subunit M
MTFPLLSVITLLPLLGAIVILLAPGEATKKPIALVWTLATFLISLLLWINWEDGQAGMQFIEHLPWAPEFGIYYFLGVDGISLFLVP